MRYSRYSTASAEQQLYALWLSVARLADLELMFQN